MITALDLQRAIARAVQVRTLRAFVGIADCYDLDVITTGKLQLMHVCCSGWAWHGEHLDREIGVTVDRTQFVDGLVTLLAIVSPARETATVSRCEFRGADEVDWTKPLGPKQKPRRCLLPGLLIDDRIGNHERRRAVCVEHGASLGHAVREHPHANINWWPDATR